MPETKMMRAITQQKLGGIEVLETTQVAVPRPGIGEILVRVHAASVNPTDWKHRATGRFLGEPPFILGWDLSGTVAEVGLGVTIFKPGDEVFGMLPYPHGVGAHAEFVTGPARAFVQKPKVLSHIEAAALPLVSLTAWQALVDTAALETGQRVLIHAAAGGVGHVAVQIAKARGAHVTATASKGKHDLIRQLGADEIIDYRAVDFAEVVSDVDVVFDTIGGDYQLRSLQTLKRGGTLVSIVPVAADGLFELADRASVRVELMLVEADRAGMEAVADLVNKGQLRPIIAQTFELEQAAQAHEVLEAGHVAGKLVLEVLGALRN